MIRYNHTFRHVWALGKKKMIISVRQAEISILLSSCLLVGPVRKLIQNMKPTVMMMMMAMVMMTVMVTVMMTVMVTMMTFVMMAMMTFVMVAMMTFVVVTVMTR